jgi:AcrR family transcriptional regulator
MFIPHFEAMPKPDSPKIEKPLSVSEAKALQKQDAILSAALTLFAERGFHGTAVPDVAGLAKVGAGTIYRYFDSKEALVNGVFQQAKALLRDELLQDFDPQGDVREAFRLFWQRLTGFARRHPLEFRFLELQDHVPYLNDESRQLELQLLLPIHLFCQYARDQGIARDMNAGTLMAMIWGAVVGLFKAEHLGYLPAVTDDILFHAEQTCWDMFCRVPNPLPLHPAQPI